MRLIPNLILGQCRSPRKTFPWESSVERYYRDGYRLIFRPWIRQKDGTIIYARSFGKRAFPLWVPDDDTNKNPSDKNAIGNREDSTPDTAA
jgi:hypothetical protein